jgi:Lrp/AsnC family leucine-responsive transcriptional regulator
MSTDLDGADWGIIGEVQHDARLSFNQIAERVNLSAPSVAARIRRLEQAGVIEGYHARASTPPPLA